MPRHGPAVLAALAAGCGAATGLKKVEYRPAGTSRMSIVQHEYSYGGFSFVTASSDFSELFLPKGDGTHFDCPVDYCFEVVGDGAIQRINQDASPLHFGHSTTNRFDAGVKIALNFPGCGITLKHSATGYIRLGGGSDFVATANSQLTLTSVAGGVWQERDPQDPQAWKEEDTRYYTPFPTGPYGAELVPACVTAAQVQAAIDRAESAGGAYAKGGLVLLEAGSFDLTEPLTIPAGVVVRGAGAVGKANAEGGATLLSFSDIDSSQFAVTIEGHSAGLEGLRINDATSGHVLKGGVLVKADGAHIEAARLADVHIFNFWSGAGLSLFADNGGFIFDSVFDRVRVRASKVGIEIEETRVQDAFINSNMWIKPTVTGGCSCAHYGLHVKPGGKGGNNNVFHQLVVDISKTANGHIVFENGQAELHDVRLEGTAQDDTVPIVYFADGADGSTITGMLAHGLVVDDGDNDVRIATDKSLLPRRSGWNLLNNPTFHGVSSGGDIPKWEVVHGSSNSKVTDAVVLLSSESPVLKRGHNVVQLTVPAGKTYRLRPIGSAPNPEGAKYCAAAFHVHAADSGKAKVTLQGTGSSMGTSDPHPGGGKWRVVGSQQGVTGDATVELRVDNSAGGSACVVKVSAPTFVYGRQLPTVDQPLTPLGGSVAELSVDGVLTTASAALDLSEASSWADEGATKLKLPRTANTFELSGWGTVHRINDATALRFAAGTVVTLLFDNDGITVNDGSYISLRGNVAFESSMGAMLRLVSKGTTWREVDRQPDVPLPPPLSFGVFPTVDLTSPDVWHATNQLRLPRTAIHFQLTNTHSIQRINQPADRFPIGTMITLFFVDAGATVFHGGYVELNGGVNFVSTAGSSLQLVSDKAGQWLEVSRQPDDDVEASRREARAARGPGGDGGAAPVWQLAAAGVGGAAATAVIGLVLLAVAARRRGAGGASPAIGASPAPEGDAQAAPLVAVRV